MPETKRPAFNWESKNKKAFANSANIKVALDYLDGLTDTDIAGLRNDKKRSDQKDDAFTAIHLANEALGRGTHTKERALGILNKLGIDPFKEARFLGKVQKYFERRYEDVRTGHSDMSPNIAKAAANAAKEITTPYKSDEKPEQAAEQPKTPEDASQNVAATATAGQPETSSVAAEKATTPKAEPEAPKEEPKTPEEEVDLTRPVKPEVAVAKIKDLRQNASDEIDKIVQELKTSKDPMAKLSLSKVLAVKKSFERKMEKYEKNAAAGPHSARKALNFAQTDAYIAKNTAFKHTLKGAVRRGIQRAGETATSLKNRIKSGAEKLGNKIETSETLKKVHSNIKPAMEKAKAGVEAGVEKMGQAYTAKNQQDEQMIRTFLGPEKAKEFKNGSMARRIVLRNQARAARNAAMKGNTAQAQPTEAPEAENQAPEAQETNQNLLPYTPPLTTPIQNTALRVTKKKGRPSQNQLPAPKPQKLLPYSPPQLEDFDYARRAIRKYIRN